jgi:hypothetical protein
MKTMYGDLIPQEKRRVYTLATIKGKIELCESDMAGNPHLSTGT